MMGIVLGVFAGLGILLCLGWIRASRSPSMSQRVLAQVRPRGASLANPDDIARPLVSAAVASLDHILGGGDLERRLRRCGLPITPEQFRTEQVLWGLLGSVGAVMVTGGLAIVQGSVKPVTSVILALLGCVTGLLLKERWLDVAIKRREQLIVDEFPTIAELLALSVAAGEGVFGAVERVIKSSSGALGQELEQLLSNAQSGIGLSQAFTELGEQAQVPVLARFADAVSIAMERGTPMAEIMRAQAADIRDVGRRTLMESAGRKEIAMMIPVVFLVLPVTVVFALFPGFIGLSMNG